MVLWLALLTFGIHNCSFTLQPKIKLNNLTCKNVTRMFDKGALYLAVNRTLPLNKNMSIEPQRAHMIVQSQYVVRCGHFMPPLKISGLQPCLGLTGLTHEAASVCLLQNRLKVEWCQTPPRCLGLNLTISMDKWHYLSEKNTPNPFPKPPCEDEMFNYLPWWNHLGSTWIVLWKMLPLACHPAHSSTLPGVPSSFDVQASMQFSNIARDISRFFSILRSEVAFLLGIVFSENNKDGALHRGCYIGSKTALLGVGYFAAKSGASRFNLVRCMLWDDPIRLPPNSFAR